MKRAGPNQDRFLPTPLILLLLFVAAWAPRALALDAFVTPDERKWMARSASFYTATVHGDFAATYQSGHPGVTVMWAGSLGLLQRVPDFAQAVTRPLIDDALETWLRENTGVTPLDLLVAGRWWIALAIATGLAGAYLPLRRLYGESVGLLVVLLLAWDPFFVGLSRQLHLDGLLAVLTCLSLLSFVTWLYRGRQSRYLLASGLLLGLAALTKTPAMLLTPAVVVLMAVEGYRQARSGDGRVRPLLRDLLLWGCAALATYALFWPAMWVDPVGVPVRLLGEMLTIASGHDYPNYFLGAILDDPGPAFYPVAFLFRTTPVILLGLVAILLLAIRRRWPLDVPHRRRISLVLLFFTLLFLVGMTAGTKKFDRYGLPAFVILDILAGVGWAGLANWAVQRWRTPSGHGRRAAWMGLITAILVAIQGLLGCRHYPYYLTYYNPLTGGSRTAPAVLLVGWGEGLDAAARWLNDLPGIEKLRVVSWYDQGPTSYFLKTERRVLTYMIPDYWLEADYAVIYSNQWQRDIPSKEAIDYFETQQPEHVVRRNGLDLAKIYDIRDKAPPAFTNIQRVEATFGDRMQLAGYRLKAAPAFPGDSLDITLFLEKIAPAQADYNAHLSLVSPSGAEVWGEERPPAGVRTTHWPLAEVWQDPYTIGVPEDVAPGEYEIRLSFRAPISGERLPASGDIGEVRHDGSIAVGVVHVQRPPERPLEAAWANVRLTGVRQGPEVVVGERLILEMYAAGQVDGSIKLSLRLLDPSGNTVAQSDGQLLPEMRFVLPLPGNAQPGPYTLAAVVYDPATLAAYPDEDGAFLTSLLDIEILAGPHPSNNPG